MGNLHSSDARSYSNGTNINRSRMSGAISSVNFTISTIIGINSKFKCFRLGYKRNGKWKPLDEETLTHFYPQIDEILTYVKYLQNGIDKVSINASKKKEITLCEWEESKETYVLTDIIRKYKNGLKLRSI